MPGESLGALEDLVPTLFVTSGGGKSSHTNDGFQSWLWSDYNSTVVHSTQRRPTTPQVMTLDDPDQWSLT